MFKFIPMFGKDDSASPKSCFVNHSYGKTSCVVAKIVIRGYCFGFVTIVRK